MFRSPRHLCRSADPYKVLGLSRSDDITASTVKKAFKARAAKLHPDVGGDAEEFKQVRTAYEALLRRHGGKKSDLSGAQHDATDEDAQASQGRGFYDSPHARWSNATANERREHHYDHESYTAQHGAGLGEEFSAGAGWSSRRGRWENFSTRNFYRPYQSDFSGPYGHGFTPEEIQAAEEENRKMFWRYVVRHTLLWGSLLCLCVIYRRCDRVNHAVRAREQNYRDPAYWAAVDEAKRKHGVLRLEGELWWEKPLTPLWHEHKEYEKDKEGVAGGGTDADAPAAPARPGHNHSHPLRVVSFRNRPFTPNGVRSPNAKLPKTKATYLSDVSFDLDDEDEEGEL